MKLLLDTHTLIWALTRPNALPHPIQRLIADHRNAVFVSSASLFEIAAKRAATGGRSPNLGAEDALVLLRSADFAILKIEPEHAAAVETLAPFHGDPFDRLLLAQATVENLRLVTHDERLAAYSDTVIAF